MLTESIVLSGPTCWMASVTCALLLGDVRRQDVSGVVLYQMSSEGRERALEML